MIKVTCFNCKQSWTIPGEVEKELISQLEEGQTHLSLECPKCRKINKATVKQPKKKA